MGDAGAPGAHHLVARADDVAAGTQLDLAGQRRPGSRRRDIQRQRREGRDRRRSARPAARRPCDRARSRRAGSAPRGCSAPTAPRARPRAAPAGRHSGRTARRWRRACRTGWRRCPRPKVSSAYFTTSWPAAPIACTRSCPVNSGRSKRARTSRLSIAKSAGPGRQLLLPGRERACRRRHNSRSHSRIGPAP